MPGLEAANPLLIVTMGDRIVTASMFRQLSKRTCSEREADLTLLTALYEPPRNRGKGRVLRDEQGRVIGIIEERDIDCTRPIESDDWQRLPKETARCTPCGRNPAPVPGRLHERQCPGPVLPDRHHPSPSPATEVTSAPSRPPSPSPSTTCSVRT